MDDSQRRETIEHIGITIAIDGPAGSGKSTVSKELAHRLGIGYLDTGAMYRALTWYCLENQVDLSDADAVAQVLSHIHLKMDSHPASPRVWVNDVEVSDAIREPRIALEIKHISTNLQVRQWMGDEQRRRMNEARATGSGMVAEGRDMTTVVCPDADVRVLILADMQARLERRTLELYGDTSTEHLNIVRAQVEGRDRADSTVVEFMTPAEGVHVVDSTGLNVDGVVDAILEYVDRDLEQRAGR